MKIIRCTRCVLPVTKPYLEFDSEGVCSACRSFEKKNLLEKAVDWQKRGTEFDRLVAEAIAIKAPLYDALVPVSGGKDSISQIHRLLRRNLRILAVNVDYGIKTDIGRLNLSCIPKMGVNLITYTPMQPLHRELVKLGFEQYGDPDLLSHCMLHAYPLRIAIALGIPLVLLGENSASEYSGETGDAAGREMTRAWFDRYAANSGNTPKVIAERHGYRYEDLITYDFPDDLDKGTTRAIFCSHYFRWDSEENLKIAQEYGFRTLDKPSEGTFRNYVGIDEKINRIHQYLKVLKFGYGRATDHACEDIRNGRLTRHHALELIQKYDFEPLSDYYVTDFIDFIGISRADFEKVIERYRRI